MTLDAVDHQILSILQCEGRITNAELAGRVGLTPGPTLARVSKLESAGFINGYVALVDRERVGLPVTAFVSVILKSHGAAASRMFVNAMAELPEVLEVHHIAGDEDYLLKVVASDPADYEQFVLTKLAELPDVQRIKTTFVLSTAKIDTKVPIRERRSP